MSPFGCLLAPNFVAAHGKNESMPELVEHTTTPTFINLFGMHIQPYKSSHKHFLQKHIRHCFLHHSYQQFLHCLAVYLHLETLSYDDQQSNIFILKMPLPLQYPQHHCAIIMQQHVHTFQWIKPPGTNGYLLYLSLSKSLAFHSQNLTFIRQRNLKHDKMMTSRNNDMLFFTIWQRQTTPTTCTCNNQGLAFQFWQVNVCQGYHISSSLSSWDPKSVYCNLQTYAMLWTPYACQRTWQR